MEHKVFDQSIIHQNDPFDDLNNADFSDWTVLTSESENPNYLKNPYQTEASNLLTDFKINCFIVEKESEMKKALEDGFHHFYYYFSRRIAICLGQQQPHQTSELLQKSWVNQLEDLINAEMPAIQQAMKNFCFTPAWVLKNCLDLLHHSKKQVATTTLTSANTTKNTEKQQKLENKEQSQQQQQQLTKHQMNEQQLLSKYKDFLEENFVDLLACAASKDILMFQELVGDRIGSITEDHKLKFKKKSLQICKDNMLRQELLEDNNQHLHQNQQQQQLFGSLSFESLHRSWSTSSQKLQLNLLNNTVKAEMKEQQGPANESYSSYGFQIAKLEILTKKKQYLHAFLILKMLNSSCKHVNNHNLSQEEQQIERILQIQELIETYFDNDESDLVQLIIFRTLNNSLTSTQQIIQCVESLHLNEKDMHSLQMWLLFLQSFNKKFQILQRDQHQIPQIDDSLSNSQSILNDSILYIQKKLSNIYQQKQQLKQPEQQPNYQVKDEECKELKPLNQSGLGQSLHEFNTLQQPHQQQINKTPLVEEDRGFLIVTDEDHGVRIENSLDKPPSANNFLLQQQFNVLSLDGGGIRGIIQLILLAELEARTGKLCNEIFNMFAGTSIGAIIALALAKGTSAESLLFDFLGRTRNKIFSERHYLRYILGLRCDQSSSQVKTCQKTQSQTLSKVSSNENNSNNNNNQLLQLRHPLYDSEGIEDELQRFFEDQKLKDIGTNVIVSSCDVDETTMKPCLFYNFIGPDGKPITGMTSVNGLRPTALKEDSNQQTLYQDVLIREIARASSAAYPFLSATEINGHQFVDGGFLFNNVDILVINFLKMRGIKLEQIHMLSLGNYPNDTEIKTTSLQQATTMAFGMWHELKNILNPESYFNDYFAAALTNFDHSITESQAELTEKRYTRLEPAYHGRFIQLDSTSPESLKELKEIGANWIETLDQQGIIDNICSKLVVPELNDICKNSIAVIPRYYSYQDLYKPIEDALELALDDVTWKQRLLNFQFPKHEQSIIKPANVLQSIKGFFQTTTTKLDDQGLLLAKAAAIGHIPSMKRILQEVEEKEQDQILEQNQVVQRRLKEQLIRKPIINGWNSLHHAAANGEIAAFIYLISQIFDTRAFFCDDQNNLEVPQRVKRSLQDLQWMALKDSLREFLEDAENQQKPYSNQYAPFFNYSKTNTINLAEENSQHNFKKVMQFLLEY